MNLDAIRDSKMFVVVISENYARSPWCLNELVEILSCKETENQVVPVFYYVHPSDVRHQKGSFGDALDDHYQKKRYSPDTIDKWRLALAQIAELSGYHLEKHANGYESETIQNIVEKVARQVTTKALHLGEDLFGIDSAVEEIYEKLMLESNDVRAIGICGMGGIGKTTTAKAFYNKYSNTFESSCFIENVKQYSQGGSPLLPLLEQLLNALLRRKDCKVPDVDNGIRQLKQILCFKKTLIVLDDLDQSSYSEFLARNCNLFSAGSRIVITTRDVHLLNQLKIDLIDVDIYMVKKLGEVDSLFLSQMDIDRIKMPVIVTDTKLVSLTLKCNIGVWLPVILSFFALKDLTLGIGSESSSSTKPFSLSKLYNLQYLVLSNCTSFGSSFPELPLSITNLILSGHLTLSHLPDLSSLQKLKKLEIYSYISLQTLPPLPPHLQSLILHNCTSLQHLSDMSMLKELSDLQFGRCSKRKSVGLKKSFLQVMDVRKHFLPFYKVEAPKTAEWFSYKSTGRTVSFDIPTLSADNFLGLALSVLLTSKNWYHGFRMEAEVTNKTNGTTKCWLIPVYCTGPEVHSVVKCIRGDEISIRSGDKIKIVLQRQLSSINGRGEFPYEGVKVEMFAAHVIQRTLSTPDFPSALNNIIN